MTKLLTSKPYLIRPLARLRHTVSGCPSQQLMSKPDLPLSTASNASPHFKSRLPCALPSHSTPHLHAPPRPSSPPTTPSTSLLASPSPGSSPLRCRIFTPSCNSTRSVARCRSGSEAPDPWDTNRGGCEDGVWAVEGWDVGFWEEGGWVEEFWVERD